MIAYNKLVKGQFMNFNDFCDDNENLVKDKNIDKFKKINENLHKNEQKTIKNDSFSANFNKFSKNASGIGKESFAKFNEEDIKEKISKYQNMSQSELMNELLKESAIQKQKGNLDNKKLSEIKESMSGFMTPEQNSRLDELIKMLR